MLVTDVVFHTLSAGEALPAGVVEKPNSQPPPFANSSAGATGDFRMEEGKGNVVLNYAGREHLDRANLDWVVDEGRPALRSADNPTGREHYRRDSGLARQYLEHKSYLGRDTLPVAVSGHHGADSEILEGLTLAAGIKPASEMGKSEHQGKGHVIGYGARRFILGLLGQKTPYQLTARINVNDSLTAEPKLDANRWSHIALTAEPRKGNGASGCLSTAGKSQKMLTKKFASPAAIPHSIILGAELFYFHDAYYRGLIGRTLTFKRALNTSEVAALAR